MVVKAQGVLWMNTASGRACSHFRNSVMGCTFNSPDDVLWMRLLGDAWSSCVAETLPLRWVFFKSATAKPGNYESQRQTAASSGPAVTSLARTPGCHLGHGI